MLEFLPGQAIEKPLSGLAHLVAFKHLFNHSRGELLDPKASEHPAI
jgi:hypothetical protein